MAVAAQIQFLQPGGGGTGTPGQALAGSLALPVTGKNFVDNGVVSQWTWELVDVPSGSALLTGVVQQGNVPTFTFTPDVRGAYLLHLTVRDQAGNFAEDFRVFQIAETTGRFIPSFKSDAGSYNRGGQLLGWHPDVVAYLKQVDAGGGGSFTAGGDLVGSSTVQRVASITGASGTAAQVALGGVAAFALAFAAVVTLPVLAHTQIAGTGAANGVAMIIQAQQGQAQTGGNANTNGGTLALSGGAAGTGGGGAAGVGGNVELQTAGTIRWRATASSVTTLPALVSVQSDPIQFGTANMPINNPSGATGKGFIQFSNFSALTPLITIRDGGTLTLPIITVLSNTYQLHLGDPGASAGLNWTIVELSGGTVALNANNAVTGVQLWNKGGSNTIPACEVFNGSGGLSILRILGDGSTLTTIRQVDTVVNSATGQQLVLQAQNATGTTTVGGILALTSGTGTTTGGNIVYTAAAGAAIASSGKHKFVCATQALFTFGAQGATDWTTTLDAALTSMIVKATGAGQNIFFQVGTGSIEVDCPTFNIHSAAGATGWAFTTIVSGAFSLAVKDINATSVTMKQNDQTANSTNGSTWTMQAQNSTGTTTNGGAFVVTSGTGTTFKGSLRLQAGGTTLFELSNVVGANRVVAINRAATLTSTEMPTNTGDLVMFVGNAATDPTANSVSGGILYSSGGAGKWRGTGGTVTTFGPAEPHCPRCGRDYALEWQNEQRGEHLALCLPCMIGALERAGVPFADYAITDRLKAA